MKACANIGFCIQPYLTILDSDEILLIKWLNQRLICKYKKQTNVSILSLLSDEDVSAN